MVLSGEGSDEIFGGYLYFHKAPNKEEFHQETCRKVPLNQLLLFLAYPFPIVRSMDRRESYHEESYFGCGHDLVFVLFRLKLFICMIA